MPETPSQHTKNDTDKSVVVVQNKVNQSQEVSKVEGAETEIAASIHVVEERYWGWAVVAASACILAILDGVTYTFGSMLGDISTDLKISLAFVTLINSLAMAMYFTASPLVAALINRFGFRAICMTGSIICSIAMCVSSLTGRYSILIVSYGIFVGFGFALINMASMLVVGFYFEKHRSVAMSFATAGSSVGVMVCYPLYSYLVKLGGWRPTMMLHSGLFGMVYFLAMAFRPLTTVNVVKTTTAQEAPKTVTLLPTKIEATKAERLFNAVHNTNFPTAAAVVEEHTAATVQSTSKVQAGPSTPQNAGLSNTTITAMTPGSASPRETKQVHSKMTKGAVRNQVPARAEIEAKEKKLGCCDRLCQLCRWHKHVSESRPMYRDDAFYTGKVKRLQVYKKSRQAVERGNAAETELEYKLAVARAATTSDLAERRGVFTTAIRRVLATMLDLKLMRRQSYLIVCVSGMLSYLGYLVPYVFIQSRNLANGVDPIYCSLFVSVIGFSNFIGRLTLGVLATKFDPLKILAITSCVAGLSTVGSCVTYNVIFQYSYCIVYGYCISGRVCLRSIVFVALYGLDKLTNATGICLLFQGIGCLISTPLSSVLQSHFGYATAFVVAGTLIFLGGLVIFPVETMAQNEDKQSNPTASTSTPNLTVGKENEKIIQVPSLSSITRKR